MLAEKGVEGRSRAESIVPKTIVFGTPPLERLVPIAGELPLQEYRQPGAPQRYKLSAVDKLPLPKRIQNLLRERLSGRQLPPQTHGGMNQVWLRSTDGT